MSTIERAIAKLDHTDQDLPSDREDVEKKEQAVSGFVEAVGGASQSGDDESRETEPFPSP